MVCWKRRYQKPDLTCGNRLLAGRACYPAMLMNDAADLGLDMEPVIIDVASEPERATVELFRMGSADAARAIIELAKYGAERGDRIRLDAAKYIIDRVLGKIAEPAVGQESEADRLIKEVNVELAKTKGDSGGG